MDFLSIILAALGIQRERASKASDRKIEAYRLVSEVSVEAAHAANMVAMAMPGIMRRLSIFPSKMDPKPDFDFTTASNRSIPGRFESDTVEMQTGRSFRPLLISRSFATSSLLTLAS